MNLFSRYFFILFFIYLHIFLTYLVRYSLLFHLLLLSQLLLPFLLSNHFNQVLVVQVSLSLFFRLLALQLLNYLLSLLLQLFIIASAGTLIQLLGRSKRGMLGLQ